MKDNLFFKDNHLRRAHLLQDYLDQCHLSEIAPKGQHLTWTNNRKRDEVVWERLDIGFANSNWFRSHDNAQLVNQPIVFSDHGAMIVFTQKIKPFLKRPYRFKAMWTTHFGCEAVIQNAWSNSV